MKNKIDKAFNAKELQKACKDISLEFNSNISKTDLLDLIIEKNLGKEVLQQNKGIKKEILIYCGPNIGSLLVENSTFRGGYPVNIKKLLKDFPLIKKLFVKTKDFARTKYNIQQEGSIENIYYKKILEYRRKVGE